MKSDDAARHIPASDEAAEPCAFAEYFGRERLADLQRFVRSQCPDPSLAEEIVQDTLVVTLGAWKKVGNFDNPMGWIIKAARNVSRRAFRRASVERARNQGFEIVINEPFHKPIDDADAEIVLCALLGRLSQRQSEVFSLAWLGYKDQDIAQILEITPSTVRSHLEDARNRLQGMMDEGVNSARGERNED
jgi:RNA polymerase sigma-70 factor, ECF subfamily